MPDDAVKTSEFWTACLEERGAPGRAGWMYAIDHPRLRAGLYDMYLGGLDPFSWMRARMLGPAQNALEIGCGGGDLAFGLIEAGACERIDAFDIAEGAIAAAQTKVRELGLRTLRFHWLDGNTWSMPRASTISSTRAMPCITSRTWSTCSPRSPRRYGPAGCCSPATTSARRACSTRTRTSPR